jgi:hypothetical protein
MHWPLGISPAKRLIPDLHPILGTGNRQS